MFFDDAILDALAKGAILSALGLFWIIFLVRVVGLRSFSKMTNFDFVMTVAMGSVADPDRHGKPVRRAVPGGISATTLCDA